MSKSNAAAAFDEGKIFLQQKEYASGLQKLREAVELDGSNPEYLTTLGVMVSRIQKNHDLGETLCQQAIRKRHNSPQLYLNLADVYIRAGKKVAALDTLISGYKYTKRDRGILEKIRSLGMRRPPVLRFLGRSNPLNRLLGRLRHVLMPLPGID